MSPRRVHAATLASLRCPSSRKRLGRLDARVVEHSPCATRANALGRSGAFKKFGDREAACLTGHGLLAIEPVARARDPRGRLPVGHPEVAIMLTNLGKRATAAQRTWATRKWALRGHDL